MSFALNGVGLTHANGFAALREITLKAEKGERIVKAAVKGLISDFRNFMQAS